jgi:aminoglycoside phosphotransferase (APT) family kinase protein
VTGSADMTGTHPLPLSVDDLTAEWLTAALRTRHAGVEVSQARQLDVVEGTATKVLFALEYAGEACGLPRQMWVKGGFADHREYVGALGVYTGEVRFFAEVAPAYRLHHPQHYFALAQDEPVQGIVALEDLHERGVTFARATTPMTAAQVDAGLETLAHLHGQTWGRQDTWPAALPLVMDATTDRIWRDWFSALPAMFAAPRAYAAAVVLHDPDRLIAAATAYRARAQHQPACVLHGDAHIGNAYVERDGTVGFVDWQTVAAGHWAHDVNYFIVSALDVPDRRAHEHDLLDHYLKSLAAQDVTGPTREEAWDDYRRATVYGFLCWLCNPDIWQPPDVNTATYARFATAMLDHETYAALGV